MLCTYEIDCEGVIALRDERERSAAGVGMDELACPWFAEAVAGRQPASWRLAGKLIANVAAGLLTQSFVRGATLEADINLVLWRWSCRPPHKVALFDPSGRRPKNQRSWD